MLRVLLALHAHLPWVREPEQDDFLEEDWLHEARFESYLPLVGLMDDWVRDGVSARLALSISPTLCEMLVDPALAHRFELRLERLIRWAHDASRASSGLERAALQFHYERFVRVAALWARYHGANILRALVRLSGEGVVDLMTTAASHAYLPLWQAVPEFIDLQLRLAASAFQHHTGLTTRSFWLPECGFAEGIDEHLAQAGFLCTFLDTHGLRCGHPRPRADVYRPVVGRAGVFAFARDPAASLAVWSAEGGYPGDPRYREFHRDFGSDEPRSELGSTPRPVGIKPYAVTGREVPLGKKAAYVRQSALQAVRGHAADFLAQRLAQAQGLEACGLKDPVVVAPFDAELFGHWWFEGPEFLDAVVRSAASAPSVELVTAEDVLVQGSAVERVDWAPSSWGRGGYSTVWLEPRTAWLWPQLHGAARRLFDLVGRFEGADAQTDRVLAQMGRELLLAAASDWPFQMTEGSNAEYAEGRVKTHLKRFAMLADGLERCQIDGATLEEFERRDAIFPWLTVRDLRPTR